MTRFRADPRKIVFLVIIIFGLTYCARIYGLSEQGVATLQTVLGVIITAVSAVVAWYVYRFLMTYLIAWFDESVTDGRESSVYPLFSILGKVLIVMAAIVVTMSSLGVDLLVALTSAGIVGLAITFGAQSTLSQFFSGLNLLLARPFKAGDVVMLNDGGHKLRVIKVGLMNTVFQEWDNAQIFSMPNDAVASSTVANMTHERGAYCMILNYDLHYRTDLRKAKELTVATVLKHPNVLKDGDHMPEFEIEDLKLPALRIKVTMYIDDFARHDPICSEVRSMILEAYLANGIEIRRPQSEVIIVE